jgi:hypothetical protein
MLFERSPATRMINPLLANPPILPFHLAGYSLGAAIEPQLSPSIHDRLALEEARLMPMIWAWMLGLRVDKQ